MASLAIAKVLIKRATSMVVAIKWTKGAFGDYSKHRLIKQNKIFKKSDGVEWFGQLPHLET